MKLRRSCSPPSCSSWSTVGVVARRNHRADPRQGERRDLHQDRSRDAPGRRAPPEGAGDRPQERSQQRQLRKALDEITPQMMVDAVDEMLIVQRGKELGYKLSDEQFKSVVDNIRKENKIETDEQFQAALKPENMTMADLRRNLEKLDDRAARAAERSDGEDRDHRGRSEGVLRRAPERVHHAADGHAARDSRRRCRRIRRRQRRRRRSGAGEGEAIRARARSAARASRSSPPISPIRRRRRTAA